MGLDMYLSKRTYLSHEAREQVRGLGDAVETARLAWVVEDVGQWRKANAIHRWFVEQVQGGQDDCRTYEVTRKQLQGLLEVVEQVLARPELAPSLLPTQEGFFFGSTAYDDGYWAVMEQTRRVLTDALADENASSFEYGASW